MVFLDRFAQMHLENCIFQGFQEPAPEIYPNPFQGLKPPQIQLLIPCSLYPKFTRIPFRD